MPGTFFMATGTFHVPEAILVEIPVILVECSTKT
jgi:hypothetical protein